MLEIIHITSLDACFMLSCRQHNSDIVSDETTRGFE